MERRISGFSSFLFLVLFATISCAREIEESIPEEPVPIPHYLERGQINVITDYNSVNYFIYRGQPMGFQYELLNHLGRHLEVEINISVANDLDESFSCLSAGTCDLIAKNIAVTRERTRIVDFTVPHSQTRQVLVQRKPERWQEMTRQELENYLVRNVLELGGMTVHVPKNSSYASRLNNLMEETGDTIFIKEVGFSAEELVNMVAEGEISFTVVDENIAIVNDFYHGNIDIGTPVSLTQNIAWAVRKGDTSLRDSINVWLRDFKTTSEYRALYEKYFKNQYLARVRQKELHVLNSSGRLSPYDDLIRKYSEEVDWDWRLIASMIYQESRFRHDAESWAGASGLMQLMPATAEQFGVTSVSDPEENIRGGVRYIKWLDNVLKQYISEHEERVKFVLASYNAGIGHVFDARALARKYERDPDRWSGSVDYFLLNKSDPKYFQDPVVRHGYVRGNEPYRYVGEVLNRYAHYRNILSD